MEVRPFKRRASQQILQAIHSCQSRLIYILVCIYWHWSVFEFLTSEPNGVGECVYGIGRVLRRRRRRRHRDTVSV